MTHTDSAVLNAAQAGDRAAFAAVVARTAPDLYATLPHDIDRYRRLHDVYVQAMRDLHRGVTPADLTVWLTQLASAPHRRLARKPVTPPSFSPDTDLDVLWRDLAPLWPSGTRRAALLTRRRVFVAGVLVAVVAAVAVFLLLQGPRLTNDTLRATVYQPDRPDQTDLNAPPTDGSTPTVPVIPLPPPSADDPRPTPESPTQDDDEPSPPGDSGNETPDDDPSDEDDTDDDEAQA